jgi:uncharacterized protein
MIDKKQTEAYVEALRDLQATSADVEGAALISAEGDLLAWNWNIPDEAGRKAARDCAELMHSGLELGWLTERGDADFVILPGQTGSVVLAPVGDRYVLAVLVRENAKLGLIFLDIKRGPLGPGLAGTPIVPRHPPKRDGAHADPEYDDDDET